MDAEDALGEWTDVKSKQSKHEENLAGLQSLSETFIYFSQSKDMGRNSLFYWDPTVLGDLFKHHNVESLEEANQILEEVRKSVTYRHDTKVDTWHSFHSIKRETLFVKNLSFKAHK